MKGEHAMQKFARYVILILGLLSFGGIAAAQADTPPDPVHIVIENDPASALRRANWTDFSALQLGGEVVFGDLIRPGEQPTRVLCADLSAVVITEIGPVPCPQERSILTQGDVTLAGWQRAAPESFEIPFLITPRATMVSTAMPLIQWNPITNADGYRVIMRSANGFEHVLMVDGGETASVIYPTDAPPLLAGESYTVEVVVVTFGADGRSSTEESAAGISFSIMDADTLAEVTAVVTDIRAQITDGVMADYVVARYYRQRGLNAEAITLLTAITGDLLSGERPSNVPLGNSAVLYLLLGDLYLEAQLDLYARVAYANAFEVAEANGDLESQALAAVGLARVLVNPEDQAPFALQAVELLVGVGDEARADAIRTEFALRDG
jgi:hypothetical protein